MTEFPSSLIDELTFLLNTPAGPADQLGEPWTSVEVEVQEATLLVVTLQDRRGRPIKLEVFAADLPDSYQVFPFGDEGSDNDSPSALAVNLSTLVEETAYQLRPYETRRIRF